MLCTPWHFIIRTTKVIKFLLQIQSFSDMFPSRYLPIEKSSMEIEQCQ